MTNSNTSHTQKILLTTLTLLFLTGFSAAAVSSVSSISTPNVEIGQSSTTQTISFTVSASDTNTDTITVDLSNAASNGASPSSVSTASVSGESGTLSIDTQTAISGNTVTLDVSDSNTGDTDDTVSFDVTYDTTGISSEATGVNVPITASTESASNSGTFDFVDTTAPSLSSATTVQAGALSGNSVSKIDVTFTETGSGLDSNTIAASDFSVGGTTINSDGADSATVSGNTVTLTYDDSTPQINTGDTPDVNVVSSISDDAGNSLTSGTAVTPSDGISPVVTNVQFSQSPITDSTTDQTVTVTYSETMDNTANPTITFSDSITKSTASTSGWSDTNVASDTFARTFTVDDSQDATGVTATVDSAQDDAPSNNVQTSFTSSGTTFDVDRVNPTVTQAAITTTISSDSNGDTGVANPGDTITVEWDDSSNGDNNADTISSVSVDLSAFGCGNSVSATSSSNVWTATCDVSSGSIDSTGLTASVTATDDDGNSATQADDNTVSVDNEAPTISTAGDVALSTDVDGDGIASIGDTLKYSSGTEGTGDTVSWSVGLSTYNLGTLNAGNAKDVVSGSSDGAFSATETVTDDAGNTVTGQVTTSSFTDIDNTPPTVGTVTYTVTDSNSNNVLNIGETIEVTADMSGVSDLSSTSPVTVDLSRIGGSATQQMYDDGSTGGYSASDDVYTYTATVSETEDADTSSNTYNPTVEATDDASNTDSNSGTTISEGVDTNKPTLDSVSYGEGTDTADETLTLTFSEDIGTVGATSDYTVTYSGSDGTFGDGNERSVSVNGVADGTGSAVELTIVDQSQQTDSGGNFRVTVANPGNVLDTAGNSIDTSQTSDSQATSGIISSFDTNPPTVSTFTTIDRDADGQVDAVNVDFSEPVQESSVEAGDFQVGSSNTAANSVAVDAYGPSDGSNSDLSKVQIQFTQGSNEISGTGVKNVDYAGSSSGSTTVKDTAGNALADITDQTATDNAAPQILPSNVVGTTVEGGGDTITVTFTEDVSGSATKSNWDTFESPVGTTLTTANAGFSYTSNALTITLDEATDGEFLKNTDKVLVDPASTSISDGNGQNVADASVTSGSTASGDSSAPTVSSAVTADTNSDGNIDEITVTFNEKIDDSASDLTSSEFALSTGTVDSVNTGTADDNTVKLTVSGISDTSTTPDVTSADNAESLDITDYAGNTLSTAAASTLTATTDGAAPVLLYSEVDHSSSTGSNTYVTATFSENVDTSSSPSMDIDGTVFDNTAEQDGTTGDSTYTVYQNSVINTGTTPEITAVSVTGSDGNAAVLENGNNVEIDTFRKTLGSGWNFVSFPIAGTSSPDVSSVLGDTSNVNAVWKYASDGWESWTPQSGDQDDFSTVSGGEGYLVDVDTGYTIAPNVNNVQTTQAAAQVQLSEGYNLVGQFEEFHQDADATGTGAFASLGGSFWKVSEQSSGLQTQETAAADGIKTGSAYWVQTQGDLSDGTLAYTAN